jgi:hypothetical protein
VAWPSPGAGEPVPRPTIFLRQPGYQAGCGTPEPSRAWRRRVEIPLESVDLPGREQAVQSGASCSYGVSQRARESGRRHPGRSPRERSADPRARIPGSIQRSSRQRPGLTIPPAAAQGPGHGRTTRLRPPLLPVPPATPGPAVPAAEAGPPRRPRLGLPRVATTTTRWHRWCPRLTPEPTATATVWAPRAPTRRRGDSVVRSLWRSRPGAPDGSMIAWGWGFSSLAWRLGTGRRPGKVWDRRSQAR